MINFYPGPSKIYTELEAFTSEAFQSGILSMNHRSDAFMEMLEQTVSLLKEKLLIPQDYAVCLVSSATECWEIIAQSLAESRSYHLYNGAFGEKWYSYTRKLFPRAQAVEFDVNCPPGRFTYSKTTNALLCLTHNETSNGSAIPADSLRDLRKHFNGLIAVDATSSMAGVTLEWNQADIWFASVQKCFGLPPGLGILILSPEAIDQANRLNENSHYNSLRFLLDNFSKNQTPYTPNTLGIYLLNRILGQGPAIGETAARISERALSWYSFFENSTLSALVSTPILRSETVIAIHSGEDDIARIKQAAVKEGIILGNGYGAWKKSTLRIANFPAITNEETDVLKDFFRHYQETH